jgi:O-acetyl-ADP-ribose deacetylase (regulator of RNase III)
MLQHAKGNLIDMAEQGMFDVIIHGCNCQNTMGSGIAKELRDRYPEVYVADNCFQVQPEAKLENFSSYFTGKFLIVNAYTQLHYLPRGVDHFEYESFKIILRKMKALYRTRHFGFPYIGMGLAGGDKDRIMNMIIEFANDITAAGGSVTLVEFSG